MLEMLDYQIDCLEYNSSPQSKQGILLGVIDGVKDGVNGVKMPVDGNGEVDD